MKERILLIDSDKNERELMAKSLLGLGYEVDIAGDGLEGIQKFGQTPPQIVIVDTIVNKLSGIEICRRLQYTQLDPKPAVFLLSSALTALTDELAPLKKLGIQGIMVKPFDETILTEQLNKIMIEHQFLTEIKPERARSKQRERGAGNPAKPASATPSQPTEPGRSLPLLFKKEDIGNFLDLGFTEIEATPTLYEPAPPTRDLQERQRLKALQKRLSQLDDMAEDPPSEEIQLEPVKQSLGASSSAESALGRDPNETEANHGTPPSLASFVQGRPNTQPIPADHLAPDLPCEEIRLLGDVTSLLQPNGTNGRSISGPIKRFMFPQLIAVIHQNKLTGCLSFSDENNSKSIHIKNGQVTKVHSQKPSESLYSIIQALKPIPPHIRPPGENGEKYDDVDFGKSLILYGVLNDAELQHFFNLQRTVVLLELFQWKNGQYTLYDLMAEDHPYLSPFPLPKLLSLGIKKFYNRMIMEKEIGINPESIPLFNQHSPVIFHEFSLAPNEQQLLSRIDGHLCLRDLTALGGMAELDAWQFLVTLAYLNLIGLKRPLQTTLPEPATLPKNEAVNPLPTSPFMTQGLGATKPRGNPTISTPVPNLTSSIRTMGGPPQTSQALPAKPETREINTALSKRIEDKYLEVKASTGQGEADQKFILEIEGDLSREKLDQAYKKLKKEFDLQNQLNSIPASTMYKLVQLQQAIIAAYNQLTQQLLAQDEEKNKAPTPATPAPGIGQPLPLPSQLNSKTETSGPPNEEVLFKEGLTQLNDRNFSDAEKTFHTLFNLDRENVSYCGYLGWAMYNNPQNSTENRQKGTKLIKKSLYNDAKLPQMWYFLGLILNREGDWENALTCFDNTLKKDPNHKDALRNKRTLEIRKQQQGKDLSQKIMGIFSRKVQ
jgi:CheY-like chemotaxis protein/tetratricopeptide (TPR) repeat protein